MRYGLNQSILWQTVAALLFFLPLPVWAQGALEGTVRAADTDATLADVQVVLPDIYLGDSTEPDGFYRIERIPVGSHLVEVRLLGYRTEFAEVLITDGATVRLDMHLVESAFQLDEVAVVGSRTRQRTVTESMVPIDIIASDALRAQGDVNPGDQLRTMVPSFNVNPQAVGDAARIVRPASLRGLAPDHTLVLVNGKRRHRAAIITWIGNGVADGAQGPDISSIPAIALQQVEVLRDGASAQYGSDAIAGVMNFALREDRSGGSVEVHAGGYGEGDGETWMISGHTGLPLGETGFLNFSAEYGNTRPTSRSVQRDDAALLVASGNTHIKNPAQISGRPRVEDDVKLWSHFGYPVHRSAMLYGHANYAAKSVTGGFFFRNPHTRAGVFKGYALHPVSRLNVYNADGGLTNFPDPDDPGQRDAIVYDANGEVASLPGQRGIPSLLVGDGVWAETGVVGAGGCPTIPIIANVPDAAALEAVENDPDCFTLYSRFPGGFTPQFGGDLVDGSVVAGVRGYTDSGFTWDLSGSYGMNTVDFFIRNTVNASLGAATPTEFDPGLYSQRDINLNLDLTWPVNDRGHLAGGAEWRDERFEIGLGQVESYRIGPYAGQGFSAASNGFPGFGDIASGAWNRSNVAVYGDAGIEGSEGRPWGLDGVVRFENFSDFGSTLNGKVSGRYELAHPFALRAGFSTGFRAPTPGQQNAFNVTTQLDQVLKKLVNNGTIPSTSQVAALRGGQPLDPETSMNYTAGLVLDGTVFNLTADYYRIDVSDRIALTQVFALAPEEVDALVAEGITSAGNLANFRFFTNDFSTRTQGVDIVATYVPMALRGQATFSFVFNRTITSVVSWNADVLDDTRIRQLEQGLPRTRWNVSGRYIPGRLQLLGRLSYYGGWFDSRDDRYYDGDALIDIEAAYDFGEVLTLTLGARNAFNHYPERNPAAAAVAGNLYSLATPFSYNGGYYYLRLAYRWG